MWNKESEDKMNYDEDEKITQEQFKKDQEREEI